MVVETTPGKTSLDVGITGAEAVEKLAHLGFPHLCRKLIGCLQLKFRRHVAIEVGQLRQTACAEHFLYFGGGMWKISVHGEAVLFFTESTVGILVHEVVELCQIRKLYFHNPVCHGILVNQTGIFLKSLVDFDNFAAYG